MEKRTIQRLHSGFRLWQSGNMRRPAEGELLQAGAMGQGIGLVPRLVWPRGSAPALRAAPSPRRSYSSSRRAALSLRSPGHPPQPPARAETRARAGQLLLLPSHRRIASPVGKRLDKRKGKARPSLCRNPTPTPTRDRVRLQERRARARQQQTRWCSWTISRQSVGGGWTLWNRGGQRENLQSSALVSLALPVTNSKSSFKLALRMTIVKTTCSVS